jgi:hypothetical protein
VYHLIVPNKCVISSETVDTNGQRLAVSLNTLDFEAVGESTNLKLTVKMVSLVGGGMIEGYKSGEGAGSAEIEGRARLSIRCWPGDALQFSPTPTFPPTWARAGSCLLSDLDFTSKEGRWRVNVQASRRVERT